MNYPQFYCHWMQTIGLDISAMPDAAQRLSPGTPSLPLALLTYYQCAGNSAINTAYNQLLSPEDIYQEQGYLIFMHENQGVVDWGIRLQDLEQANPIVWQRNNDEQAWYAEDYQLSSFLMANWYWAEFGEEKPEEFFRL
ncbi:hypothetical protein DFR42_103476 [Undibacterium pigrum]|uniref:Uncharacterized protein n=2 Tax=Undibacterium pigrum TaxID=401470 RepID=A0A318JBH8_9BURK|nr:hypothetical protein DFR42_103476 [Undibacterium pigrum]